MPDTYTFDRIEAAACSADLTERLAGLEAALRLAVGAEDTEDRARARSLLADTLGCVVDDTEGQSGVHTATPNKG